MPHVGQRKCRASNEIPQTGSGTERPEFNKDLRPLLELAIYYRNFIRTSAEITRDLTELLKGTAANTVVWATKHKNAFFEINLLLPGTVILKVHDLCQKCIIRRDTSSKSASRKLV